MNYKHEPKEYASPIAFQARCLEPNCSTEAMAITAATPGDFPEEAETPLLNDVVRESVDFKGRPAVRSKTGCWKSASFIIGVELAERIAYCSISSNLISYLTGPLGQSTAAAAANVNTWNGVAWILPLVGGFIADSYLGRYGTIVTATLLYMLGLGLLSLSAALHSSDSQNARCPPPRPEVIFFFLSLYLTALAQAGHKPCVLSFGAQQFDDEDQEECKAKSALFNWWNFFLFSVAILAASLLNYVQDNLSWELAFGIPCIVMGFALLVFLLGTMTYRFRIGGDARNLPARPKAVSAPEEAGSISPHECAQLMCHEKASTGDGKAPFEKARAILGLASIWSSCLGYAIAHAQTTTLFVKQAATMNRYISGNFQIPAASMQTCLGVSLVVFIPIYDRILVPFARRMPRRPAGISMLQRIGAGLFLTLVAMVIAAIVEKKRLAIAHVYESADTPNSTLPMSVWWLAPQHIVIGVADVFTLIGLQEFFYDQVPREFGSMGVALFYSVIGAGMFSSSFLIAMLAKLTSRHGQDGWFSDNLNHAHLDYFYWLLCGLNAIGFAAYLYFAKSYVYRRKIVV